MNILGLDLGSNTGYAFNYREYFECGTYKLATAQEIKKWGKDRSRRRCDPRVSRLHARLVVLQAKYDFDRVVFEDVLFSSTTYQTQLWSSLRAAIWLSFPSDRIECVAVGTLKAFATGTGAATKEQMAAALGREDKRFFGSEHGITFGENLLDDNAVDAVWLWKWGLKNLSRSNYAKNTSTLRAG